jgi:hypothetical protein
MQRNTFSIFTGDDKVMNLKAVYAENGDPLDLTSCTEIIVNLPIAAGGFAHLKLSTSGVAIVTPAILGKFTATIASVVSELLNIGEFQNVDVSFTISGKIFTVRFLEALSVFQGG